MLGRDQTRNAVSPEKNPPTDWQIEERNDKGVLVKPARNIKWQAQLGSVSLGGPVIADGLVWVGTNNGAPRDPKFKNDASVLMCFRESDGQFLYQYVSPRLATGLVNDWPGTSMSTPLVERDRLWVVTNRCEVLCLDIGPLRRRQGEPRTLWKMDMIRELGVFPRSSGMAMLTQPAVGARGDWIYAVTGNGVDETYVKLPAPQAPSLVCLHKQTGKVVWQDSSPGKGILEGQWSSPLVCQVKGRAQVIVAQGDGWLRSFDPGTGKVLWKCDLNPKAAVWKPFGRGDRKLAVATPVLHEDRVYVALGLSPDVSGDGPGRLYCIDPTKEEDISAELEDGPGKGKPNPNSGIVWQYGGPVPKEQVKQEGRRWFLGDTVSACTLHDGLLYLAEWEGYLQCLDARTGQRYWQHDLKAGVHGAPLWVDGKVYLGTDDDVVWIFHHGKVKKAPVQIQIEMEGAFNSTPVFANGVLYLMSRNQLYAIQRK